MTPLVDQPASLLSGAREIAGAGNVLWMYKPAGMPVFPWHDAARGTRCLLDALLGLRPEQALIAWPRGFEGGIVHRLDNPTSGLVMVAADLPSLTGLRGLFAEKRLRKRYLFVTDRDVPWDGHDVAIPLAHDPRRKGRMTFSRGRSTEHRGTWLSAETHFRRQAGCAGGHVWEALIRTGVMHQVRVHAAAVGLALLGDRIYGGRPWPQGRHPPEGVPFLLHHAGLLGPGFASPGVEVPDLWSEILGG
jgi:23S rRNA pseudouridine1911/1915/1917 synthase